MRINYLPSSLMKALSSSILAMLVLLTVLMSFLLPRHSQKACRLLVVCLKLKICAMEADPLILCRAQRVMWETLWRHLSQACSPGFQAGS